VINGVAVENIALFVEPQATTAFCQPTGHFLPKEGIIRLAVKNDDHRQV
jgi:hypothetical protein